jgi:hypothetical protein
MPCRPATRATAASPSWCMSRVNPVGAKQNGTPAGRPRIWSRSTGRRRPGGSAAGTRSPRMRPRPPQCSPRSRPPRRRSRRPPAGPGAGRAAHVGDGQGPREPPPCRREVGRRTPIIGLQVATNAAVDDESWHHSGPLRAVQPPGLCACRWRERARSGAAYPVRSPSGIGSRAIWPPRRRPLCLPGPQRIRASVTGL